MDVISNKLLEIENLHIEYKTEDATIYAVNNLNLIINKGETLGLVGETGAGKTTTALGIMGLLPKGIGKITKGNIIFQETKLTNVDELQMQYIRGNLITMIFQDPMTSLNPIMRIGEQVAEVLVEHRKGLTKKQIEERVDEILTLIGIDPDRKNDYPHQFSGGMKQRVMIAMGLACEPELLIADEPTTALDVTVQAQVLEMMTNLKSKLNTSLIIITHDLGVVAQICDRVAVMYAGTIVEEGLVDEIFGGDQRHPYTEGLLESLPNFKKEVQRLKPIPGNMPDPTMVKLGCPFVERCNYRMIICYSYVSSHFVSNNHRIQCNLFDNIEKENLK